MHALPLLDSTPTATPARRPGLRWPESLACLAGTRGLTLRQRARHALALRLIGRTVFTLLRATAAAVFLGVVAHHVVTLDFKPLAAFCLPFLVAFFGFTSLLYMRGRSLGRGRDQRRTLFAAERSMQGAVAYVSGIVVGASLYGLLQYLDFRFDPAQPTTDGLWLLAFLAPYALMQAGFFLFMSAVWIIVPQFLRPVSAYEVWRRVAREP